MPRVGHKDDELQMERSLVAHYTAIVIIVIVNKLHSLLLCLQCFDAVGWALGSRKGIRPVKN